MDTTLYETINGLAGHNKLLDVLFITSSRYGPFLLLGILALLWFWPVERPLRERRQRIVLVAILSICIALLLNQIIIHVWNRPRPFVAHAANLLLPPSQEPSFPSDHATFAFAIAIALFFVSKRAGFLCLLFAGLIAFSRVYTGEHYVSDVVAGAVIGTGTVLLSMRTKQYLCFLFDPLLHLAHRLRLA